MHGRIVLASASPRRRALLAAAGIEFDVRPADVDETVPDDLAPETAATQLAERKARAVAQEYSGSPTWVLGADTVVAIDGPHGSQLLGKPVDEDDARRMLAALSGSRHRVVTGVAVVRCTDGELASGFERTWVTMRPIEARESEAYVASGEWRDKAGGYAIQETADRFVTGLEEGGFDNVVGLPVARALALLAGLGGQDPSGAAGKAV